MPCFHRFEPHRGLLVEVFHGEVAVPEVLRMYDSIIADPLLPEIRVDLCDLNGMTGIAATAQELGNILDLIAGVYHSRRDTFVAGATVAGTDRTLYVAHAFLNALTPSYRPRFRIVPDLAAAERFLGLSDPVDTASPRLAG